MNGALQLLRYYGICILLALLTACGGGGGGGSNANPNADDDNDGTVNSQDIDDDNDGLIEIATLEQLDWVRNDLAGTSLTDNNANTTTTGCPNTGCNGYELVANLNFDTNGDGVMDANDTYFDYDGDGQDNGWLPIGSGLVAFTAIFEGNSRQISNLYINRATSDTETGGADIGLFGAVGGGTIRNLALDGNLMQTTGANRVGGLAGWVRSNATVTNCSSAGGVSGSDRDVGGLVGRLESSTVTNSYATGSIIGDRFSGGLVGAVFPNSSVSDSYATGSVTSDIERAGGLAGTVVQSTVARSYATGTVSGGGQLTGGLIGLLWNASSITDSYATGPVVGRDATGGLVGSVNVVLGVSNGINSNVSTISNSFATGAVSTSGNNNYVGGLIGISYHMNLSDSFASGNVSNANRFVGGFNGDANTGSVMGTSYSVGAVSGTQDVGAFVGWSDGASYVDNYFANDQGQVNAIGTNNSGGGVNPVGTNGDTLANLLSVTNAGNGGFTNWSAVWDFGTNDQLPGLIIDGVVYRPDISLGSANGNYSGIGTFTTNIRVVDLNGTTPPIEADCVGDINIVVDSNAADILTGSGRCVTPANFATYTVVGSFQNNVDFTGMITIEFSRVTHILSFSGSRTGNVLNATFAGRTPQTTRLVIDWDGSFSATRP